VTAILEPPTATATATGLPAPTGSPAPALAPARRPRPALPPVVPPAAPVRAPEGRQPREKRVLTAAGVRLVGAVLVAVYVVGLLLEPAANGPAPVLSLAEQIVGTVMTFLLVGALAGFVRGRRWALPTALAFSALEAVNVALCPATGHHVIGWWWYAQVGLVAVMVALPALVLARTRAG
jgi:hypothetical protein